MTQIPRIMEELTMKMNTRTSYMIIIALLLLPLGISLAAAQGPGFEPNILERFNALEAQVADLQLQLAQLENGSPTPDFDSEWIWIDELGGLAEITHNLGTMDLMVYIYGRRWGWIGGVLSPIVHQRYHANVWWWSESDDSLFVDTIEAGWDECRVLIWTLPETQYEPPE